MKQKILIAEDEADIRNILRLYLESEGFQVIEAGDGQEALDAVRTLLDKYEWREFVKSPESPFRLLRHIAKGNDFRVRCALFGIYRVLHSRLGTKLVDLCTRIINLRGSAR